VACVLLSFFMIDKCRWTESKWKHSILWWLISHEIIYLVLGEFMAEKSQSKWSLVTNEGK
jgi:hypothetical protein